MSSQDQTTVNAGTGIDESLLAHRIFDRAKMEPSLSRFVEALQAAQFDNDLLAPDYRTLFAPTNEALDAAPDNFWDKLLRPENSDRLHATLALHIVRGRQSLADLKTTPTLKSLDGEPVDVPVNHIVRADIACTNGQIHIIDKLLLREYSYAG